MVPRQFFSMAFQQTAILFFHLALASVWACSYGATPKPYSMPFNRSGFPPGFIFGAGSAAYQSEGAAHIDGKGPSVWDTFTKNHPEKIADGSNGDVADDFYHRFKEDIKLMKKVGLDSFRFSISWSRVLPKGKISGGVNPRGINFYNDLIDELLVNGLKPFVTLLHFDTPQALEDEYGSLLSPKIIDDFVDYADICFKTFGDRVKMWVTINEPNGIAINAYGGGTQAPGRCSKYVGNCTAGNSATEPYIVAHNLLLAHASAVKLYKQKYKAHQKGKIGITIVSNWFMPKSQGPANRKAALRTLDFTFGWFAHPITYGDYPQSMITLVGSRLPKFTKAESKMIAGSIDFLSVNYYTANYAEDNPQPITVNITYATDRHATLSYTKNGVSIGTPTALSWLFIYPRGILEFLLYIKENYNNPTLYVTENGMGDANNITMPVREAIKDALRIRYYHSHLSYLLRAIKEGVKVKGFYLWSFFDDFEWDSGYTARFGITYVDYKNNLKRYLKYSAYWLKMFLLN